jgi:hypothetical protein
LVVVVHVDDQGSATVLARHGCRAGKDRDAQHEQKNSMYASHDDLLL